MKTLITIIVSLFLSTQAYAWGKGEQSALLGFLGGALVTHYISTNYNNTGTTRYISDTVYEEPTVRKTVIYTHSNDFYERRREYNDYEREEYHYNRKSRHHPRMSCNKNVTVVNNRYKTVNYY